MTDRLSRSVLCCFASATTNPLPGPSVPGSFFLPHTRSSPRQARPGRAPRQRSLNSAGPIQALRQGAKNLRPRYLAVAAALSAPAVFGLPALGAECLDVQFPDSVKVGNSDLVLNGMGIRDATFLSVKVYVAGLYLPEISGDEDKVVAANEPWKLVLNFVHDADASDIRNAFDESFEKAAGDNLDALSSRIDTLKAQMVDFEEGQVLSYTYDPATGTVINVNGTNGTPIEGADFAAALLTISIQTSHTLQPCDFGS